MTYRMARHHRRSIRLRGYDYTQAGAYFVTICTQDRACLLGEVVDGVVRLNEAGAMVQAIWEAIPTHYPGVKVDAFVAMPNHVHGIIVLPVGAAPCGGPDAPHHDLVSLVVRTAGQAQGTTGQAQGTTGQAQGTTGQAQGPAPTNIGGDGATDHGDEPANDTPDVGAAPCGRPGAPYHDLGALSVGNAGQAQGTAGQAPVPAPTNMGDDGATGTGGENHAPATPDVGAAPCGRPGAPHHDLVSLVVRTAGQAQGTTGQAQGPAPTNTGGDGATGTGADKPAPATPDVGAAPCGRPHMSPMSVGDIVQRFKSLTTRRYSDGVRELAWPEFRNRLWQRNYHEHVIRNEADLNRIRQYILNNPAQWAFDSEYLAPAPAGTTPDPTRC